MKLTKMEESITAEEFEEIVKNRRKDLKKYYKEVKVCILCKKEYGNDYGKSENKICPECLIKLQKENKAKN